MDGSYVVGNDFFLDLMGQVKKMISRLLVNRAKTRDSVFFEGNGQKQILQSWQFYINEDISTNLNRLVEVQPVINYSKNRSIDVYEPCQQLPLNECIISWRLNISIQKPESIIDYNKYLLMKVVDRAEKYLSYYSIFRKT